MKTVSTIILFIISCALYAQSINNDPDTSHILSETIIIAPHRANEIDPLSVKNLDKMQIERVNFGQEPSFILNNLPSVNCYSDAGSFSGYAYFRLRGVDQTRINMTLDGIPLNEPEDQGAYFSNYPDFLNSVNSMQVQRGVGITSNGVASYAGSINFESPQLMNDSSLSVSLGYGSFNSYRMFAEYQSGKRNKTGYYLRATHQHSDGYKQHSGNTSQSVFFGAGYFGEKNIFKLTGFVGNQKNQLAWIGIPMDVLKKAPTTNANSTENDNFSQALLGLHHIFAISSQSEVSSAVYYNFLDGNYDFDLNNFLGLAPTDEMYNYHFRHHFVGAFSNYSIRFERLKINAGVHLNHFQREHLGSERSLGELYKNTGFKRELSTFIKTTYHLVNFRLFGSFQFRHTDFNYDGLSPFDKKNWNFVNWQFGTDYQINNHLSLYYSLGQTSREPTRNDLFYGEDDLPVDENGASIVADISPESVLNHELGLKFATSAIQMNLNAYFMSFENEITLNGQFGPNGLPLHSNVANSFRSGVELDILFLLNKHISFENNSSFSNNQIEETGTNFGPLLSPEVIVNQGIIFDIGKFNLQLNLRYQSKSYIDFANQFTLPEFISLNSKITYTVRKFEFNAGVNNLTNSNIFSNGYIGINNEPLYFIQASTNYFVSITWTL